MNQVYVPVKVTDEEMERHGQVGVVVSANPAGMPIDVKFDDGEIEQYEAAQLQAL